MLLVLQPLGDSVALDILFQSGDGLRHLHTVLNLVHCDVRTDNVLVQSLVPFRVLITDFGLSHRLSESASVGTQTTSCTVIGPVGEPDS